MAFRISSPVSFVCFPVEHGATCTTLKIRAETLLLTSRNTAYTIDDVDVNDWGQEGQVDWFEAMAKLDGKLCKLQLFAMRSMANNCN